MTDMHNFKAAKKRAIDQMYEMNKKACESNDFKDVERLNSTTNNGNNLLKNFNISVSDDELIVIGLLLILSKDCSDTWLFLALLYILL